MMFICARNIFFTIVCSATKEYCSPFVLEHERASCGCVKFSPDHQRRLFSPLFSNKWSFLSCIILAKLRGHALKKVIQEPWQLITEKFTIITQYSDIDTIVTVNIVLIFDGVYCSIGRGRLQSFLCFDMIL